MVYQEAYVKADTVVLNDNHRAHGAELGMRGGGYLNRFRKVSGLLVQQIWAPLEQGGLQLHLQLLVPLRNESSPTAWERCSGSA